MKRLRVAVLYGGRSGEHEISLLSARSVVAAMDRDKYDVILVGIDPEGRWHRHSEGQFRQLTAAALPRIEASPDQLLLTPSPSGGEILRIDEQRALSSAHADVVFPVLHGTFGEDGTVQGLLELADLAYVGAGVLGSAVGMDKDVQKRLFRDAGLPIVDFLAVRRRDWARDPGEVRRRAIALGLPVFVKPANLGSSVGITKVKQPDGLGAAIEAAFDYDDKVVIEKGLSAREIECAVLGNESPEASVPGEVSPQDEFYSYEAKYVNENGATFAIPAPLSPEATLQVRALAVRAFEAIECEGMARVDFFVERGTDRLFLNEVNTIPGFTSISQYPKLWEASGLPYGELIDRLISLAIERHQRRSRKKVSYRPPE